MAFFEVSTILLISIKTMWNSCDHVMKKLLSAFLTDYGLYIRVVSTEHENTT